MGNRKERRSRFISAELDALEPRKLFAAFAIPGSTSGANTIEVEFHGNSNGTHSVSWAVDSNTPGSASIYDGDRITIPGGGGDDTINVSFDSGYNPAGDSFVIIVNGGRGEDDITVIGGPGAGETMAVNGYDDQRTSWDAIGDRDDENSTVFDADSLTVVGLEGAITFDDGDAQPETDIYMGAFDPVVYDDSGRTGDWNWAVGSGGVVRYDPNDLMNPVASVLAFPQLDSLDLTLGDGDNFVKLGGASNVTVSSGDGDDTFDLAGDSSTSISGGDGADTFNVAGEADVDDAGVSAILNGDAGNDHFNFGTTFGSLTVHSLAKIYVTYDGGSGTDDALFDDSDGGDWGAVTGGQSKFYQIGDHDLLLTRVDGTALGGPSDPGFAHLNGSSIASEVLYMQQADTPGVGVLESKLAVNNPLAALSVSPGATQETLDINLAPNGVHLAPSDGGDEVSIKHTSGGTEGTTIVEFEGTATQHVSIGALKIDGNSKAILNLTAGKALKVNSLTITSGGTLDIANCALILFYPGGSPISTINSLLASGYDGGTWSGSGINSSVAAADTSDLTAVGSLDNVDFEIPSFGGFSPNTSSILIKYTYYGDADLNGVVDSTDYSLFQYGYLSGPPYSSWAFGDFNYSNDVDATLDFGLLQNGYTYQGSPL